MKNLIETISISSINNYHLGLIITILLSVHPGFAFGITGSTFWYEYWYNLR